MLHQESPAAPAGGGETTRRPRGRKTSPREERWRQLTAPLRSLPHYLILGAQKGGTTTLNRLLREHPGVLPSSVKEINFFSQHHRRGVLWYRSHFPLLTEALRRRLAGRQLVTGETSPNYLLFPHAARRARRAVPNARLIVLLRDPVSRAYSHYHHMVRIGAERLSFEEAIEAEPRRVPPEAERVLKDEDYDSAVFRQHSYLTRGIYVEQVRRWLEVFPREQVLILKSEDFSRDPGAVYRRVLDHVGLRAWEPPAFERSHVGGYPPMDAGTRARLREFFAPHNERLYEYLGRDFGW